VLAWNEPRVTDPNGESVRRVYWRVSSSCIGDNATCVSRHTVACVILCTAVGALRHAYLVVSTYTSEPVFARKYTQNGACAVPLAVRVETTTKMVVVGRCSWAGRTRTNSIFSATLNFKPRSMFASLCSISQN
jgi:hypothetical protein